MLGSLQALTQRGDIPRVHRGLCTRRAISVSWRWSRSSMSRMSRSRASASACNLRSSTSFSSGSWLMTLIARSDERRLVPLAILSHYAPNVDAPPEAGWV
jgi:hypothetical protein